jgi:hypothetical protein
MGADECGSRKVSFLIEQEKYDLIEKYAHERGEKFPLSYIIIEAIDEYIDRKEHPEYLVEQLKAALVASPELIAPLIKDEVRFQLHEELHRILGEQYRKRTPDHG